MRPRITRSILMIEMEDGTQYGYDVAVHQATITLDPREVTGLVDDGYIHYSGVGPQYGSVLVEGMFRQIAVRAGAFTEQSAIESVRKEIER